MAKVEFPYNPVRLPANQAYPSGNLIYRPSLLVTLIAPNGESLRFQAVADSGADSCVFPLSAALLLKLDVLGLPRALSSGVGNTSNVTYYQDLTIDLGYGLLFDAYVGFTAGLDSLGLGLLGQSGFFEKHNVEFLHKQRRFTVEAS